MSGDEITYEDCYNIAKQCLSSSEMEALNKKAYRKAVYRGWIKDYTWLKKRKLWDRKSCYEEARKHNSKISYERSNASAYNVSLKNGWLEDYFWFKKPEPKRKWSHDAVMSIARNFQSKSEFRAMARGAYSAAYKNGWLKEMDWFVPKVTDPSERDKKLHCVYIYINENTKTCYVGLTNNLNKRHSQHKNPNNKSAVYKYFNENNIEIPFPIVLENSLTPSEAQYYEDFYVKKYREEGWNVLNKAATGVGVGAYGGCVPIYTFEVAKSIAMRYEFVDDFKNENESCYDRCLKKGWLKEFDWLKYKRVHWTFDMCRDVALNYSKLIDFQRFEPAACDAAYQHGWIEKFDFLERRNIYWTEETALSESKKFGNYMDFRKGNPSCFNYCVRHDILKNITWFEQKRAKNGYWTLERAIEKSKEFRTVGEFKKHCSRGYKIVCENKKMDELVWLSREHEAQGYWSDERIESEARKYTLISDFKKNSPGAYYAAHQRGVYKKFYWLKRKNKKEI